jgi:transaldolase
VRYKPVKKAKVQHRKIKIFADGADKDGIAELYRSGVINGFTTNPTLMRKAGIVNYEAFAHDVLAVVTDLPISFEVFSDDFSEMHRQALKIADWGANVYVKIPVMNPEGASAAPLIRELAQAGVKLNITALLTHEQVLEVAGALNPATPAIVSVFAGRIADTGVDPVPIMCEAKRILCDTAPRAELLWASVREMFNIVQAEQTGCDIVTVTHDLLRKLPMFGMSLHQLSLETVRMFSEDARHAGFVL